MTTNQPKRTFQFAVKDPAAEPALAVETDRMREQLRAQSFEELAVLAGASFLSGEGGGRLDLRVWGEPVILDLPGLVAQRPQAGPLALPGQALLMYYLTSTDGLSPAGEWVSFADLPGGRMYAQAFQGYSGNLLSRAFGMELEPFRLACLAVGGEPVDVSDAGFSFIGLPKVPVMVTYWLGDDEFPSSAKVLFDRTATHHLPIDVCAILGSMLVSKILKARKAG